LKNIKLIKRHDVIAVQIPKRFGRTDGSENRIRKNEHERKLIKL
jgi:hypothetical protein